ncbi:MAG: antibiotic biosynthesis monooxygenase, partial [Solirubrobacterales bacterium]
MSAAGADAEQQAAQSAPATVVLSQSVKPGRDEDFRRWQEGVNRAVASFDGFLGTEVVPPGGEDREWTVIYRFGSRPQLEQWLASSARAEHLDRGADLFDAPASQRVLIGKPAEEFVTVVVSHPVEADRVEEFLAWQQRVIDAERTFPGFGGSELFRPVPGAQDEWTTVFRFDTQE